ncbi:MAG: hypothetical protein ACK5O7_02645 [Holosporales bacterium]
MDKSHLPLCVDLDGTFLRTDVISEALIVFLRGRPWRLFRVLAWLLRGRAHMKAQLAREVCLDVKSLPINERILDLITESRKAGQQVILVTAADAQVARQVAEAWPVFDDIMASDGTFNLRAANKAQALVERFGKHRFIYVGNAKPDIPVWAVSAEAIGINLTPMTAHRLRRLGVPFKVIAENIHRDLFHGMGAYPFLAAPFGVALIKMVQKDWPSVSFSLALGCLLQAFYFLYFAMRTDLLRLTASQQTKKSQDFATGAVPLTFAMKGCLSWAGLSLFCMGQLGSIRLGTAWLIFFLAQAMVTIGCAHRGKKYFLFSAFLTALFLLSAMILA